MATAGTVKDASPHDLVKAYASHLKRSGDPFCKDSGMSCIDYGTLLALDRKCYDIFLDFMTRVTKFEDLVRMGGRMLSAYQSELELFRRPPLDMENAVIGKIIEANNSKWMKSYIGAGCRHHQTDIHNIDKINAWQQGLHEHRKNAKSLLKELRHLLEDGLALVIKENERLSHCLVKSLDDILVVPPLSFEEDSESENQHLQEAGVSEYALTMQAVYNMLEADYIMQEKVVSSLNLLTPSAQLESYCLMWELRPFVDDDIIAAAWRHVK